LKIRVLLSYAPARKDRRQVGASFYIFLVCFSFVINDLRSANKFLAYLSKREYKPTMIKRLLKSSEPPSEDSAASNNSPKALPPLTEKQAQCLEFIHGYFLEHGLYPTQREVADAMNLQSSTAETYLDPLRRKGYLHRSARKQRRNIRLTPVARQLFQSAGLARDGPRAV
jgi:DNA-binding MarR family transcriptional regulator